MQTGKLKIDLLKIPANLIQICCLHVLLRYASIMRVLYMADSPPPRYAPPKPTFFCIIDMYIS